MYFPSFILHVGLEFERTLNRPTNQRLCDYVAIVRVKYHQLRVCVCARARVLVCVSVHECTCVYECGCV
jgi:hypothetical protein